MEVSLKSSQLSCLFLASIAAFALTASAAHAQGVPDPAPGARTCGTPRPSGSEMVQVERTVLRLFEEQPIQAIQGGTIRVAFHVITSNRRGDVTDQQIADQIAELNRAYGGFGYQFQLVSVSRTAQPGWFNMTPFTGKERHAKEALAVDPAHTLNIYTCNPGQSILGWTWFPWMAAEGDPIHGVVVHYASLPGGALSAYNLGRTAVHEVGHYLGLLHTFENGCDAPGDFVEDTPFEASPAFGCPVGRNSCPDPPVDPIHNYMDYGDDPCITEFTAGQEARMQAITTAYRPSLFATVIARDRGGAEIAADAIDPSDQSGGIEFRGAGPNPFRSETAVRFTLPRAEPVTLQVFNVNGQRVRSLIDAQLPAGSHAAMFSGRELPTGLYFLQLKVGAAQMTRSVILIK
jgi:hypothetical protein